MAKLSVALAGIFTFSFLLFALPIAHARTQSLSLTENEESKSDFNPIVRLPSNTDNAESELSQDAEKLPTPEDRTVEFVPLRFARFRPVNRHFGLRLGLPSSRSCHHHLHRHPHHDGLFPRYGFAVARDGENVDFNPVIIRGRVRRIRPRWISIPQFHHHHHHDDEKNDHEDDEFQSVLKNRADFIKDKLRKRFHHDHHDGDSDNEDDEKIFKRKEQKHEEDHDDDNLQSVLKHSADFAKKKWKKHSHHNHDEGDIYDEEDENMFKRKAHKHAKKNEGGLLLRIRKMIGF